jgi:UDPglucose 6-dehydrogenase
LGEEVYYFDPKPPENHYKDSHSEIYRHIKELKHPLEVDSPETYYVVCVGDRVTSDGRQDISLIKQALDSLKNRQGVIVLRSTILPHYLKDLDFDYYVPEFLHEKRAVEESVRPHLFVVSKKPSSNKNPPKFFAKWEKSAYKKFSGYPEEASIIKYLSNIWNSLRIAFINEFGDAIVDPQSKDHVAEIEKIVDFMFGGKSYLRYGRSFTGHCLPKDTLAFYSYFKNTGKNTMLIESAFKTNDVHKDTYNERGFIKEWFSEWEKPEVSGRVALASLFKVAKKRLLGFYSKS